MRGAELSHSRQSHCTVYSIHCTLYTVHSTLYTVHSTIYTLDCTLYTVYCTLYTVHSYCTVFISCTDWCTMTVCMSYSVQYNTLVHRPQCYAMYHLLSYSLAKIYMWTSCMSLVLVLDFITLCPYFISLKILTF